MATAARIPIEQYLTTSYVPDAEFVNGEVEERSGGEYDHNIVRRAILLWFHLHDKHWQTRTIQEQRTRLNSDTVRIPDVSVWARTVPIEPVFSHPQLIVVEVLSPEDRHSKMQEKVEDYRRFQVPHIWVVDPSQRIGWDCSDSNWIRTGSFAVEDSPIHLDLQQLFRELDAAES
jgi:Uma2 family endonuclease